MGLLTTKPSNTESLKSSYPPPLTEDECDLIIAILSETAFKGKDVQLVYDIFNKLETMRNFYKK